MDGTVWVMFSGAVQVWCRMPAQYSAGLLSKEAHTKQRTPTAESESEYMHASAESGSDSGDDNADEAGMVGPAGCGAEGAVHDCALAPPLSDLQIVPVNCPVQEDFLGNG